MATTANALRQQVRRQLVAQKKKIRDHAKGKVFRGPAMRKLRIKA